MLKITTTPLLAATPTVQLTGTTLGTRFDGAYTATLRLAGSRDRYLDLDASGEVCGKHVTETYEVNHVVTGRRFVGTDGFLQQLLATEGRANASAIDT